HAAPVEIELHVDVRLLRLAYDFRRPRHCIRVTRRVRVGQSLSRLMYRARPMEERERGSEAAAGSGSASGVEIAPADRARLIARFGRTFQSGEALFREGEGAREAYLLQEGRVRLLKRVRLIERSLMVVRPGELFGESALLDSVPRNSTAVALTDGVALAL